MKIIVFAAMKGGVGKTTLAFNAGVEAAKKSTVFLADLDPQKSLGALLELRARQLGLSPENPMLLDEIGSVGSTAARLVSHGYGRDYLIIDTPGSFAQIIEDAIAAADCVVLPVMPSPLDLVAQEEVARIIERFGKLKRTLFVVNRVGIRSTLGAEAFNRVKNVTPNAPVRIADRADYVRAMIAGRTGAEMDPDAHREIAGLWQAIQKIIGKERAHEKVRPTTGQVRLGGRIGGHPRARQLAAQGRGVQGPGSR
jgi:chromosome partitioning protein